MLSATSHIGLEFLTKFLNMSKLQNRLILLYQSLPLHLVGLDKKSFRLHVNESFERMNEGKVSKFSYFLYAGFTDCLNFLISNGRRGKYSVSEFVLSLSDAHTPLNCSFLNIKEPILWISLVSDLGFLIVDVLSHI